MKSLVYYRTEKHMQKMRACTIIYLLGMKEGENSTRDTFEKILASFEAAELVGECISI